MNRTFHKIHQEFMDSDLWKLFNWVGTEGIELYLEHFVRSEQSSDFFVSDKEYKTEIGCETIYQNSSAFLIWDFRTWCLNSDPRIKLFM